MCSRFSPVLSRCPVLQPSPPVHHTRVSKNLNQCVLGQILSTTTTCSNWLFTEQAYNRGFSSDSHYRTRLQRQSAGVQVRRGSDGHRGSFRVPPLFSARGKSGCSPLTPSLPSWWAPLYRPKMGRFANAHPRELYGEYLNIMPGF